MWMFFGWSLPKMMFLMIDCKSGMDKDELDECKARDP